jgi:hypothetical protein
MCCCVPQSFCPLRSNPTGILEVENIDITGVVPSELDCINFIDISITLPAGYSLGSQDYLLRADTPNGEVYFFQNTNPLLPNRYFPVKQSCINEDNAGEWNFSMSIVALDSLGCTLPRLKITDDEDVSLTAAVSFSVRSGRMVRYEISQGNGTVSDVEITYKGVTAPVAGTFNLQFSPAAFINAIIPVMESLGMNVFDAGGSASPFVRSPLYNDETNAFVYSAGYDFFGNLASLRMDFFQGDEDNFQIETNSGIWTLVEIPNRVVAGDSVEIAKVYLKSGTGTPTNISITSNQLTDGGVSFDPIENASSVSGFTKVGQRTKRFAPITDGVPSTYEFVHEGITYPFSANATIVDIIAALDPVLKSLPVEEEPDDLWDFLLEAVDAGGGNIDVTAFDSLNNMQISRLTPVAENYTFSLQSFTDTVFQYSIDELEIDHRFWNIDIASGNVPSYTIQYELAENLGTVITQNFVYNPITKSYTEI